MPDTRRAVAERIADDLPYHIVEEMGLGLTFRSCTCGQLPCARLRPIRDALEAVRRDEQERCAKIAETAFEEFQTGHNAGKWIAAAIRNEES